MTTTTVHHLDTGSCGVCAYLKRISLTDKSTDQTPAHILNTAHTKLILGHGQTLTPSCGCHQWHQADIQYATYKPDELIGHTVLKKKTGERVVFGWLLNIPATCECISGTGLLRQFYVLPHWDRSCRSNFPSHPVTVYWHRADQSQRWPYNARRLTG